MFDPFTLLAGLLPVVVEAGKAAVNRWVVPDTIKPANVDEYAKIRGIDLEFFKAVTEAGGTNPTYPWVEAAVRLMRPVVAVVVLISWSYVNIVHPEMDSQTIDNFAAAIGFYLFGDRTLFYAKKV